MQATIVSDNARNSIEVIQEGDNVTVSISYYDNQAIHQSFTLNLHDLIERLLKNTIAS